uniref:Cubilin-like n=1 Tax=Saccoglossus kowalevskii TaxID=10224 RepID=A0ABM0MEZ9_SACKO
MDLRNYMFIIIIISLYAHIPSIQGQSNDCSVAQFFRTPIGNITSPQYPGAYGHQQTCIYYIDVADASNIILNFLVFHIEYKLDFLKVGTGLQIYQNEITYVDDIDGFTGNMNVPRLVLQGGQAWIVFTTDINISEDGFYITYSAT